MLYPENCLERLGFNEVRQLIYKHCLSPMGQQMVGKMQVMTKFDQINKFLRQTHEFNCFCGISRVLTGNDMFTIYFYRVVLKR